MRLVLPFLLFVFMLFGCSSKQSGLYSKKGIVKCADHVEHKVCWTEHIKTWRWVFSSGNHASVLQIRFDVILIDAFHVTGFRIPDSDSISDFEEICLWQNGQRLQLHGVFLLNRCWSSPSLFFSCFASSQGKHPLPHYFIVKSDNPAKNWLKINSDSRSRAMKSISCRWVSSIREKFIISMKTAYSFSPGPGLLVVVLWEKLSFIPEIHFLAGRGFSAILTQVLLSRLIAPDSEKNSHPKNTIFSAECFFWKVHFCASLNVCVTDNENLGMKEINYFKELLKNIFWLKTWWF